MWGREGPGGKGQGEGRGQSVKEGPRKGMKGPGMAEMGQGGNEGARGEMKGPGGREGPGREGEDHGRRK